MVRCDEFYEKWQRCGNFCEKHPVTAAQIEAYLDQLAEVEEVMSSNCEDCFTDTAIATNIITESACRPLIREKDDAIRREIIEQIVKKSITKAALGEKPAVTEKEVLAIARRIKRESHKPPIVRPSLNGSIKVIQTDCLEGMMAMEPVSVDVIVTSPPNNIGLTYSGYSDDKADYLEWMKDVCCSCERVLKDSGHFFLQVGGIATHPTLAFEVLSQALAAGFKLQNQIIWVKNITIEDTSYGQFKPINSSHFLNHTHEFIFHLTKTGQVPIDRLSIGTPYTHPSNLTRWNCKGDIRCRGDVWFIPYETIQSKEERYNHPAVFPVALPEMCIRLSGAPQGSLILDPFCGSGTTLVACNRLHMNGIGFDISTEYCSLIDERLAAPTQANVFSYS